MNRLDLCLSISRVFEVLMLAFVFNDAHEILTPTLADAVPIPFTSVRRQLLLVIVLRGKCLSLL